MADPNWMVIGRQVKTGFGKVIDLLALDRDGNLVVLELKRDKTPRDTVAQVLDYGSWVKTLADEDIADIYQNYLTNYFPDQNARVLDKAFCAFFEVEATPEQFNESHQLVIVASQIDSSTERIVTYLNENYGVEINVLFFRVFKDHDNEYLCRTWLADPMEVDPDTGSKPKRNKVKGDWNGETYVSYGGKRSWSEARTYGFISGGGGVWYSKTLDSLGEGDRIWVNIPKTGYVGVGVVTGTKTPIDSFEVMVDGRPVPIVDLDLGISKLPRISEDPNLAEYFVAVKWLETVPIEDAFQEKGFFGNQNTVAKPRTPKWDHTVKRLKALFGVDG